MGIFFTGFRYLVACLANPTRESDLVNQTTNWGVFWHIPATCLPHWKETRSPLRKSINKAAIPDFWKEVKLLQIEA